MGVLIKGNLTKVTTPKTKNVKMFLFPFVKTVNESCICEKYTFNTSTCERFAKCSVEGNPNLRFKIFLAGVLQQ